MFHPRKIRTRAVRKSMPETTGIQEPISFSNPRPELGARSLATYTGPVQTLFCAQSWSSCVSDDRRNFFVSCRVGGLSAYGVQVAFLLCATAVACNLRKQANDRKRNHHRKGAGRSRS